MKPHLPPRARRFLPRSFDPRAISIVEGIRAGLAAAVPAALSVWLGQPELTLAALGALLTCIVDPAGPMRRRLPLLLGFIVLGGLFLGGFGLLRGAGIAATLAAAAPCLFACAYARVYGQPGQALGNLLAVVLLLGADRAIPLTEALAVGGIFVAGGLWALLLTVLIWRIHPYGPARRAVADVWSALAKFAAMARSLSAHHAAPEAWIKESQVGRAIVRDTIERARNVLMETLSARGPASGPAAQNLLRLEAADQLFGAMIGLFDMLEHADPAVRESADDLLRRLRAMLVVLGRATQREHLERQARAERTFAAMQADADLAPTLQPFAARIVECLRLAGKYVDPAQYLPGSGVQGDAGVPLRDRIAGPLAANMAWESASLRHAARILVVVTPLLGATMERHGPYTHWLTITLVLVMQPFFATTWQRSVERVAGSLLGGLVAMALSLLVQTRAHLAGLLPVLGALALAVRQVNYGVYIAVYTPTVILLVENIQPHSSFLQIALARAGFTVAGGLIAVVANMVLWPSWEPNRVRRDLAAALAAHAKLASAILNPGPDQDASAARREAGLSSNNLEASLARAMQEPGRAARAYLQSVLVADATLRRIAGRLVAISLAGNSGGAASRWVVTSLRALAEGRPVLPRPASEGDAIMDRLARQVDVLPEILGRTESQLPGAA